MYLVMSLLVTLLVVLFWLFFFNFVSLAPSGSLGSVIGILHDRVCFWDHSRIGSWEV